MVINKKIYKVEIGDVRFDKSGVPHKVVGYHNDHVWAKAPYWPPRSIPLDDWLLLDVKGPEVIISIDGGELLGVTGFPDHMTVKVRDYDEVACEEMPDAITVDGDGDKYIEVELA